MKHHSCICFTLHPLNQLRLQYCALHLDPKKCFRYMTDGRARIQLFPSTQCNQTHIVFFFLFFSFYENEQYTEDKRQKWVGK